MAEPPAKRQRLDMVTTIVVRVGRPAEEQDFTVLQSIATKSSKFTQRTFGDNWIETQKKHVSMPETRVSDFEVYSQWLYTGHVVTLDDLSATDHKV
ncbi:hypothetical protein MBLNU13_g02244t1 [Cladosporium sp. NU13]